MISNYELRIANWRSQCRVERAIRNPQSAIRNGFTLVEVMAVVLIIAVAAAAVTLRVQRPLRNAQMADVIGAIGQFDFTTRSAAQSQDRPLRMVMDLGGGSVSLTDADGKALTDAAVRMPEGFALARVLVRAQSATGGSMTIPCSAAGYTPTYAVNITGGGASRWLVVAGLTGQVLEVENEAKASQLVQAAK